MHAEIGGVAESFLAQVRGRDFSQQAEDEGFHIAAGSGVGAAENEVDDLFNGAIRVSRSGGGDATEDSAAGAEIREMEVFDGGENGFFFIFYPGDCFQVLQA